MSHQQRHPQMSPSLWRSILPVPVGVVAVVPVFAIVAVFGFLAPLLGSGCIEGEVACDPTCPDGFRCTAGECLEIACTKACSNGTCVWSEEAMVCDCDPGFQLEGEVCVDVDECAQGFCGIGEICTNTDGAAECKCENGLVPSGEPGDGCVSPCDPNPCENGGTCAVSRAGDVVCGCVGGWSGPLCAQAPCNPADCNDNSDCTTDVCGPQGQCLNLPCDDADPCTVDTCNGAFDTCEHTPKTCDDGPEPCVIGTCNPVSGACEYEQVVVTSPANKKYRLCSAAETWGDARNTCEALVPTKSHRLIRFETLQESAGILNDPKVVALGEFWIGLTYTAGGWAWGGLAALDGWCSGNPVNENVGDHAVAGPCPSSGQKGWQSVIDAAGLTFPFICERECPVCEPSNGCELDDCPPGSVGCSCQPLPVSGPPNCAGVTGGHWCVPTCDPGGVNTCGEGFECKGDGLCGPAS